eukprot:Gb_01754 [translate_table: standard]
MRGGCIANIGSCGTGFDSASGSVRTNRFRAEGLELADREGEKNKAVPTAESIRYSSMDEALSFASCAKCDERLVFSSLCALSREPLFRERLAPYWGRAAQRFYVSCEKSDFFPTPFVKEQSGGISLEIRWGRIHSSHFVKWGPTVSISLRVVPLPYHSFYFNKESRSVAKNGNSSGPRQLLVEGAAWSSSGGQTLICYFTPSWVANYKLFPTGRRDTMIHVSLTPPGGCSQPVAFLPRSLIRLSIPPTRPIDTRSGQTNKLNDRGRKPIHLDRMHVVVKQEMPGRSKIGPSHNTPAAVATMKKENDDPSPQPTMTHLSAAHRTTNNQVGHTQAWNNTPPDPWSADASGNWIIIEFGRVSRTAH